MSSLSAEEGGDVSDDPFPEIPVDPDATTRTVVRGTARHRRWDIALVVAAGGAVGGGARYLVNETWPTTTDGFPWATLIENVSGCLLLGVLMVFLIDVWRPTRFGRPFLATGVLGGYTTFSTYTADTRGLVQEGRLPVALVYLFGTLLLGLFATWVGLRSARAVAGLHRPKAHKEA